MKDIKEEIRLEVVQAYNEYKDYLDIISEENKGKKDRAEEVREMISEGKNDDEVEDFAIQVYIKDDFHKRDLRILGTKFVNLYRMYMNLPDMPELDSDIKQMFTNLDDRKEVQVYTTNKGKFEEINKGFIKDRITVVKENNLMPKILENLKTMLNA